MILRNRFKVDKKTLKKGEDALINSFYICILDMLKSKLTTEDFKYSQIEDFMSVYGEQFAKESNREKNLLWQTANWMFILFKIVPANKSTGLAMEVVPKLLEGWHGGDCNVLSIYSILHEINIYLFTGFL